MTTIETRDESQALQIASDSLDRYLDSYDREVFRAGWIAGREWQRAQAGRANVSESCEIAEHGACSNLDSQCGCQCHLGDRP